MILDEQPEPALFRRRAALLGGLEVGAEHFPVEGKVDGERGGHAETGSRSSFWSAGITSAAKRRMFRSASAAGMPA